MAAVLRRAGLTAADLGVVELNEAFASQSIGCIRELGLDAELVNPNRDAIALGHPLGSSRARRHVGFTVRPLTADDTERAGLVPGLIAPEEPRPVEGKRAAPTASLSACVAVSEGIARRVPRNLAQAAQLAERSGFAVAFGWDGGSEGIAVFLGERDPSGSIAVPRLRP